MIASSRPVEVHKAVPSGTIVLNRPEQRNALTREMMALLCEAIEDFQNERTVRGIILSGTGDVFSSGTDLKELVDTLDSTNVIDPWQTDANQIQELIETMLRCPKPIIAALNGDAIGLGGALALAADLRIGHAESRLWFPEPLRGLSNSLGAALLAFRFGGAGAASMTLSPEPMVAERLHGLGIIHELVPPNVVWARSHEIVQCLGTTAPQSLQLTKRFINESLGEGLWTQLSIAIANLAAARTTDAAMEGIRAFVEKRSPNF